MNYAHTRPGFDHTIPVPDGQGATRQLRVQVQALGPVSQDELVLRPLAAAIGGAAATVMARTIATQIQLDRAAKGLDPGEESLAEAIAAMQAVAALRDADAADILDMDIGTIGELFAPLFKVLDDPRLTRVRDAVLLGRLWLDETRIENRQALDDAMPDLATLYRITASALWLNVRPTFAAILGRVAAARARAKAKAPAEGPPAPRT